MLNDIIDTVKLKEEEHYGWEISSISVYEPERQTGGSNTMHENTAEYAEAYNLKYKSYMDFEWRPCYPNHILGNGMEGYDCVIIPEIGHVKHFSVRFQYKADVTGLVQSGDSPDLFILYEGGSFIYACPDLDFAKQRAYTQYAHMYGYVRRHFDFQEPQAPSLQPEDILVIGDYVYNREPREVVF